MATWKPRSFPSTPLPRLFRVEHRVGAATTPLAAVADVAPHYRSLDPFLSALLHDGADGELLLVDAVTGATVARRQVRPYRSDARDRRSGPAD